MHVVKPRGILRSRRSIPDLTFGKTYKRGKYRNYGNIEVEEASQLIRILRQPQYGDLAFIAHNKKMPSSTIRTWKQKVKKDPDYDPRIGYKRKRRAIFTIEEEEGIADYIRTNFLEQKRLFTDEDFRLIAIDAYLEKYRDADKVPHFNCSNGYIYDFKMRHRFSSRLSHSKRRPPVQSDEVKNWILKIKELLKREDRRRIINIDETAWVLFPKGILTWAERGAEDVSFYAQGDPKESVTVLAAITADNTRLPLQFIATGKTERVEESQLGDIGYHWSAHSPSGWTTDTTFMQYLDKLSQHYNGEELHVILDCYSVHRTHEVKDFAKALNINLYFIPPGCTDALQPLDRRVFGSIKATAKAIFRMRGYGDEMRRTMKMAVEDMIAAWESLKTHTIESAWSIYHSDDED